MEIKGEEKIDKWVWTVYGDMPVCKCGNFLTLFGKKSYEWICIKCESSKLQAKEKR